MTRLLMFFVLVAFVGWYAEQTGYADMLPLQSIFADGSSDGLIPETLRAWREAEAKIDNQSQSQPQQQTRAQERL